MNSNGIKTNEYDINKYIRVNKYIPAKETINVEIDIPEKYNKDKIENQKMIGILKLTSGEAKYEIIIDINILNVPCALLLSCEEYKLEYTNGNYYLKTNKLYSNQIINFKIKNYYKGENIIIKQRIDSLEGNNSQIPTIKIENNNLIVKIAEENNNEAKHLNCKIECYISLNYKISIRIQCAIIPNYSFQIYDYLNQCFTSNNLVLYSYIKFFDDRYFLEYIPDNLFEINLHFLINIPYIKNNTQALINIQQNNNDKYIKFEFLEKTFELNKPLTEFTCKLIIDFAKLKTINTYNIGLLTCNIEGNIQKININYNKSFNDFKRSNYYNREKLEKIEFFRVGYNGFKNELIFEKVHYPNDRNGIYIYPFGQWNFNLIEIPFEKQDYNNKYKSNKNIYFFKFYIFQYFPKKNEICYIYNNGKIDKEIVTDLRDPSIYKEKPSSYFLFFSRHYPLIGIYENNWYPFIVEYEDITIISEIIQNPKSKNSKNYKNYLAERSQSFSFYSFVKIILENKETALNCILLNFPQSIISVINEDIKLILDDINALKASTARDTNTINNKEIEIKNKLLKLIQKLYNIFIDKIKEINKNNKIVNISKINFDEINKKIKELNDKYYLYDQSLDKKYIQNSNHLNNKILVQDIENIIQEISKSDEEKNKYIFQMNEIISGNSFLLNNKGEPKIDLENNQIDLISSINSFENNITNIEIDEIPLPEIYSISSIMNYFEKCLLNIQLLPNYISYAVINKDSAKIDKSKNILNELYNLYHSLNEDNFSLFSTKVEEFKKLFEIMHFKLRKTKFFLYNYKDISFIKEIDEKNILDFIIEPTKIEFQIKTNNFIRIIKKKDNENIREFSIEPIKIKLIDN